MQDPDFQPPVNPLPPAVIVLFLAITGVEVVLSLAEAGLVGGPAAVGWRLALVRDRNLGFVVARQHDMVPVSVH